MRIALANADDFDTVLGLIEEAAAWLRTKGTNQWAKPWPDLPRVPNFRQIAQHSTVKAAAEMFRHAFDCFP